MSAGRIKCAELGSRLLDQVGQGIAPELAPCAEALGATQAIPLATVGPNAASDQHVAVLIGLDTLVRGQRSVGDLLNVATAVASRTRGRVDRLHANPSILGPKWPGCACRFCPSWCAAGYRQR